MSGFAAVGLQMVSSIVSGYQQSQELKSQANFAKRDAEISLQEKKFVEMQSTHESRRHADEAARVMGSLEAGLGTAGVSTAVGVPLLIKARQIAELDLENAMIGYRSREYGRGKTIEAEGYKSKAKFLKQQAKNRVLGGWLGAGGLAAGQVFSKGADSEVFNFTNKGSKFSKTFTSSASKQQPMGYVSPWRYSRNFSESDWK